MSVLSSRCEHVHLSVYVFRYTEYYNDYSTYIAATIVTRVSEAAACHAAPLSCRYRRAPPPIPVHDSPGTCGVEMEKGGAAGVGAEGWSGGLEQGVGGE